MTNRVLIKTRQIVATTPLTWSLTAVDDNLNYSSSTGNIPTTAEVELISDATTNHLYAFDLVNADSIFHQVIVIYEYADGRRNEWVIGNLDPGQHLKFEWPPIGMGWIFPSIPTGSVAALDDLSDVTITTPTNGQNLTYMSGGWVNADPSGGSGGTTGSTVLIGTVDPTTEGSDGDYYLNTTSSTLFGPKASGTWPAGIVLGGTTIITYFAYTFSLPDDSVGKDGDYAVYTGYPDNKLIGPKSSGTWASARIWRLNNNSILSRSTAPDDTVGLDGDFWFRTDTGQLFGPKAGGTWPTSNIVLTNPSLLPVVGDGTGTGPGYGIDGDYWIDINVYQDTFGKIWGPKSSGTWPSSPSATLNKPGMWSGTVDTTDGSFSISGTATNGDWYLNTANGNLFGPFNPGAGGWPSSASFHIPNYYEWPPTIKGVTWHGTVDTTDGSFTLGGWPIPNVAHQGDWYINTTNGNFFGPYDGSSWPSSPAYVLPTAPTPQHDDFTGFKAGMPGASELLGYKIIQRAVTITNGSGYLQGQWAFLTAPTADYTADIIINSPTNSLTDAVFGQIAWSSGSWYINTLTPSANMVLQPGDTIRVVANATPDATLADITWAITGTLF